MNTFSMDNNGTSLRELLHILAGALLSLLVVAAQALAQARYEPDSLPDVPQNPSIFGRSPTIPPGPTLFPSEPLIYGRSEDPGQAPLTPPPQLYGRQQPEQLMEPDAIPKNANPLQNLFTPQPQYPTPGTTIMAPQPKQGEDTHNPIQSLFTPQPQYPTPGTTIMYPVPEAQRGVRNQFENLYTPQPQYPTPGTTLMYPQAIPQYPMKEPYVPTQEWLEQQEQSQQHPSQGTTTPSAAAGKEGKAEPRTPLKAAARKKKLPAKVKKGAGKDDEADASEGSEDQQQPTAKASPLRQAGFLISSGEYRQSLSLLDQLIGQNPRNAQAHYMRAVALVYLHEFASARASYEEAIRLQPDGPLAQKASEGLKKLGPGHR